MLEALLRILLLINVLGFALMGWDKFIAKKGGSRVSENFLLSWAGFFGSYGIYLGLLLFRHKTQNRTFNLMVPLLMVLQTLMIGGYYYFFIYQK